MNACVASSVLMSLFHCPLSPPRPSFANPCWLWRDALEMECRDGNACVTDTVLMVLLSIARLTAGTLFPSITWCILSKCYASKYWLHHSWLGNILDFEPTHKVHTFFGGLTLICSVVHSLCHIARAAYEQDPAWLLKDTLNRSGMAALLLVLLVGLPMTVGVLKAKVGHD